MAIRGLTDLDSLFQGKQPFACPNGFGLVEHFAADHKTCDCFDRAKDYMGEYGYRWSDRVGHWVGQQ